MMRAFFSVIIPLYNKEKYIADTLQSVINQTFKDFEIIVVNDGSTDKSLSIVESFKNERIKVYNNKNKGLSFSRNFGIKQASSNYVAFLDSDDLWMEDYLETIYKLIKNTKDQSVFSTSINIFRNPTRVVLLHKKDFSLKHRIVLKSLSKLITYRPSFSSIVLKKDVFKVVGNFNEDVNYGEEYDFNIRCFSNFDLVFYKDPKVFYRIGIANQLTAPNSNIKRIIPDYNIHLKNANNSELKKYIDFINYQLILLYKMELNNERVKFYKGKIDVKNLSLIQKIKFYLPTTLFYYSKLVYVSLSKMLTHC